MAFDQSSSENAASVPGFLLLFTSPLLNKKDQNKSHVENQTMLSRVFI